MTSHEFKAWFTGYTEDQVEPPNQKQWDRIKARVAEIDGIVTSHPVFVDRYWHWPMATWTAPMPVYPYGIYSAQSSNTTTNFAATSNCHLGPFNSSESFVSLGQLDAKMDI